MVTNPERLSLKLITRVNLYLGSSDKEGRNELLLIDKRANGERL